MPIKYFFKIEWFSSFVAAVLKARQDIFCIDMGRQHDTFIAIFLSLFDAIHHELFIMHMIINYDGSAHFHCLRTCGFKGLQCHLFQYSGWFFMATGSGSAMGV